MNEILAQINSPEDLKKLTIDQLKALAEEVRGFILGTVSRTGGHLASNLGIVELTIALHYVFDFSEDRLLWDVGHQCYTHKILTGRKDGFSRLRQAEGIGGFPNPQESPYDQFAVGHAGTSIATAIGMALGELKNKKDNKIVALVGDASIVNGTSFEALNNLGLAGRQLLIVLNDNSMAIDPTQGAVAKYFSEIRLSHTYENLRRTSRNILEHLPVIGKGTEHAIEKIKKVIRMTLPPSQLFESLNIPYFGPIDGHDIEVLVRFLRAIEHLDHPAILHVYTQKGKGFSPAEGDLPRYHSTGPFKINGNGAEPAKAGDRPSFTKVFGQHLVKLAEKDERIVAITSAMCDGTGLDAFREKFGERFYDIGIAESAAVDIAAGLARAGARPFVCIYSTFLQRSFDQIFQEVALQNLPIVFCIDRAGVVGADGPTHHGLMDIGFLRMMPNMVLTAPANDVEVAGSLEFALRSSNPVVIRYPKDFVPPAEFIEAACHKPFELGKSVTVRSDDNSAVAIVAYGAVLTEAIIAARKLANEGMEIDVINARFAAPIDDEIIKLAGLGKGIITVEDHGLACGFGSAVLEQAVNAFEGGLSAPVQVLGAPRRFIEQNSRKQQFMQAGINADEIAKAARAMYKAIKGARKKRYGQKKLTKAGDFRRP